MILTIPRAAIPTQAVWSIANRQCPDRAGRTADYQGIPWHVIDSLAVAAARSYSLIATKTYYLYNNLLLAGLRQTTKNLLCPLV